MKGAAARQLQDTLYRNAPGYKNPICCLVSSSSRQVLVEVVKPARIRESTFKRTARLLARRILLASLRTRTHNITFVRL